jgi:hypothetical protein
LVTGEVDQLRSQRVDLGAQLIATPAGCEKRRRGFASATPRNAKCRRQQTKCDWQAHLA